MPEARSNPERHAATRRELIAAAHRRFASEGFTATSTKDVVADAGVTRGALYYHFADKTALFDAVLESIADEIRTEILSAVEDVADHEQVLIDGSAAFLDVCLRPENRRIWLTDAGSVVGWERWRELDSTYAFSLLRLAVADVVGAPEPTAESDALAHLLSGGLNEAALTIAHADNPRTARRNHDAAYTHLVASLAAHADAAP